MYFQKPLSAADNCPLYGAGRSGHVGSALGRPLLLPPPPLGNTKIVYRANVYLPNRIPLSAWELPLVMVE